MSSHQKACNNKFEKGFSLVELAIVVAIIGLVFVGMSVTFGTFHHNSQLEEAKSNLAYAKKQLINFAVVNKYMPCPDTDNDGYENRTLAATGFETCTGATGTIPYTDIGLNENQVQDSWNTPFRYAITNRTTLGNFICDKRELSSYFCNQSQGVNAWFTMNDTPPFSGVPGPRSLVVCNENAASCNATTAIANIATNSAIAVLISFNEDGLQTLASCNGMGGATSENCDGDEFYHRARGVNEQNAFFDDNVLAISGQEVKSKVLAPVVSWSSFNPPPITSPLTPTYQSFDIDGSDNSIMSSGVATFSDDVDSPDTVLVNRNVTTSVDLRDGDDYIAIGNNFDAGSGTLKAGNGSDSVYIIGEVLSDIYLEQGDDIFVLAYIDPALYPFTSADNGDLKVRLDAGSGDDLVWIQGEIGNSANLVLGEGNDILWLGLPGTFSDGTYTSDYDGNAINSSVDASDAVDDFDIVVLENVLQQADLSTSDMSNLSEFDLVIFAENLAGNREYCLVGGSGATGC